METINVILICHDIPYPANHGGKVEMWDRLKQFSLFNVNIHLITWSDTDISEDNVKEIHKYCESVKIINKKSKISSALDYKYPYEIATRRVSEECITGLLKEFDGLALKIVFVDGYSGAKLGLGLASSLNIPLIYRSHNVEYEYIKQICAAEKNLLKKLLFWSYIDKIYKIEKNIRKYSSIVYDISEEDNVKWKQILQYENSKVLNPIVRLNDRTYERKQKEDIDILYTGNLSSPNNLYGLKWFIIEVLPLLKGRGLKVVIAGSNPKENIINQCNANNVDLIANPKEMSPLLNRSKVLINPIFHGSGINMKMLEMLGTGKAIVTTSFGTRGLSSNLKKFIAVTDNPNEFANYIEENMNKDISTEQVDSLQNEFSIKNIEYLYNDIVDLITYKTNKMN